jgi:hypothetical protein
VSLRRKYRSEHERPAADNASFQTRMNNANKAISP